MIQKDKIWDLTSLYKKNYQPNQDKGWASMQRKLAAEPRQEAKVVRMAGFRRWMRVAAVFTLLVSGAFILRQLLDNGLETLATYEDMEQKIQLSDGSTIWLNENSELRYPATFEGENRVVYLKGEAFFEVAKNPNQPFIIEMEDSKIQVIGTSFNVRSHKTENFVEVQVETGKVMFEAGTHEPMALLPMDKGVFDKKTATVSQLKDENLNASAWKRKQLQFKNNSMKDIFEAMERFYKINIAVENQAILGCPFTTKFNKNALASAISILTASHQFEFVQQNNGQYLVKGGVCPN